MICPACGYAGPTDFARCPECGAATGAPGTCANCGNALDLSTFIYCPNCGAINETREVNEGVVCDTHLEKRAVAFCVICGKAVCEDCMENLGNRILCGDNNHRTYLKEWKVLHRFDFEYEAAMLFANLEQHDIESEVFSKLNPDSTDSSTRPTIVEVFVPEKKFQEAMEIAKLLGLTGDETEDEN